MSTICNVYSYLNEKVKERNNTGSSSFKIPPKNHHSSLLGKFCRKILIFFTRKGVVYSCSGPFSGIVCNNTIRNAICCYTKIKIISFFFHNKDIFNNSYECLEIANQFRPKFFDQRAEKKSAAARHPFFNICDTKKRQLVLLISDQFLL